MILPPWFYLTEDLFSLKSTIITHVQVSRPHSPVMRRMTITFQQFASFMDTLLLHPGKIQTASPVGVTEQGERNLSSNRVWKNPVDKKTGTKEQILYWSRKGMVEGRGQGTLSRMDLRGFGRGVPYCWDSIDSAAPKSHGQAAFPVWVWASHGFRDDSHQFNKPI